MNQPTTKTCERCGATLSCGASIGQCWCMDVSVAVEALQRLQAQYDDCLCPNCLRALADELR